MPRHTHDGITTAETIHNGFEAQTQNGDGTGNKLGVMTDAINTNIISSLGKLDTIITNTGASSSSGLATESTLSTLNGKVPTKGQKTMTGSIPVVLASNQSTITTTNADITKGADLSLTEAQQTLVYGVDAFDTSTLEPIRISSDKVMAETFIASVASGIANELPVKSSTNRSNASEVSYVSGQSISGSGTFTGASISLDPNTNVIFVEHNFSHTGIKYELLASIDGTNFFATGIEYNAGGMTPATLTGLNTVLGANQMVVSHAPHIKFKFTNSDSSAQTATLSYVIQSSG